MKLHPDTIGGTAITGYGPGWIGVNQEKFTASLIVSTAQGCQPWSCPSFEALTAEHFAQLATLPVELILFGSGDRLRFPPPAWLQPLYSRRIGIETMDTQAACRAFNFLAGEGRQVAAALLL